MMASIMVTPKQAVLCAPNYPGQMANHPLGWPLAGPPQLTGQMAMAGGRRGAPRLVSRAGARPANGKGTLRAAQSCWGPTRAAPAPARTHLLSVHHHGHGSSLRAGSTPPNCTCTCTHMHVKPGVVRKRSRKSARQRLRNCVPADIYRSIFRAHHAVSLTLLIVSGSHMSSREAQRSSGDRSMLYAGPAGREQRACSCMRGF